LIIRSALSRIFDNGNFLFAQAVEFVNELIDLFVGGVNLTLDARLVTGDFG